MGVRNKTQIIAEKGKQELFIFREFDAPREQVFRAFTDPDILVQFFAPDGIKMAFETADFRTGGSYKYHHITPDGNRATAFGLIHELIELESIIQTFEFSGMPDWGHVILEIYVFESLEGGRTKLTIQDVCRSVADRDMMVESDMESGLVMVFNQLDELLKSGF